MRKAIGAIAGFARAAARAALASLVLGVAVAGAAEGDFSWGLPPDYSTAGHRIDALYLFILAVTGAVFVATQGVLVWFLVRYRDRGDGRRARYTHGNVALEVVWTAIPAAFFLGLGLYGNDLWEAMKARVPEGAMPVRVVGEQFAWNFRYPGPDGVFETADDLETLNQLHVPLGTPIALELGAKDVIHSFFLPHFRVKQDAVPGLTTRAWFEATRTGTWEIACAELCGLGHYRMRGMLTVESREDFDRWYAEQRGLAAGADEESASGADDDWDDEW